MVRLRLAAIAGATAAALLSTISGGNAVSVGPTEAQAAALATAMPRAELAGQSIYFVLPDRYANGDSSNDQGGIGLMAGGFNPSDVGYFHGGDLQGLQANLGRIRDMGFGAIWIAPVIANRAVQGDSAAYHGYWGLDFTKVDPHFGSNADFKRLVDAIHASGMKLYLDIVVNHTADVISYSDGTAFSATPKPTVTNENSQKQPLCLQEVSNYHNQGNIEDWQDSTQYRRGDFFGLDDIFTERPSVVQCLADLWADWVINFGVDGFRVDTAKHVDTAFFKNWTPLVNARVRAAGKTLPQMFGEYADLDYQQLTDFARNGGLPSMLDFGLDAPLISFAATGDSADLKAALANDDYFNRGAVGGVPATNAYSLVTFTGNHDEGRVALKLYGANAALTPAQLLGRDKLTVAMLMTLRGSPVVYYGDEVGMIGSGGDKAARQDMFATQVADWKSEERVGTVPIGDASSLTNTSHPMLTKITQLNGLRAANPALATGAFILRSTSIVPPAMLNKPCAKKGATTLVNPGGWRLKCTLVKGRLMLRTAVKNQSIAWSRIDAANRAEYVVVANGGKAVRTVKVATSSPAMTFIGLFGSNAITRTAADGTLTVSVLGGTLQVLRATNPLPSTSTAPTVAVSSARDTTLDLRYLEATLSATNDPATVTFVGRYSASADWFVLGSDDNPRYRLALSDWMTDGHTSMTVAAIAKTTDGKVSVSAPLNLTW